ncbi:hypothetical protein Avbf_02348 [Armadillidium vulgare]|nr:hypothetical protein Avbf_02348 [Armadillidium vulgare]
MDSAEDTIELKMELAKIKFITNQHVSKNKTINHECKSTKNVYMKDSLQNKDCRLLAAFKDVKIMKMDKSEKDGKENSLQLKMSNFLGKITRTLGWGTLPTKFWYSICAGDYPTLIRSQRWDSHSTVVLSEELKKFNTVF